MTDLAQRGPLGLKPEREGKDPVRLAKVAKLPCVICHEWNMPQLSPTQVHHCIHGRQGTRRAPDSMTIPLCEGHHIGMFDTSKIALHQAPAQWREEYGPDTDWIGWTEARLEYVIETDWAKLNGRVERRT